MTSRNFPFFNKNFWHTIAVIILLFFAFLLRLPKLDQSIWHDEAFSIYVSSQPISAIPSLLAQDNGAPLHYYLLHGWIQLFGDSEAAARALSVLIGMALVVLLGSIARTYFGKKGQLIALLLGGIGPIALSYSQEARPYALAQLLTLLSISFVLQGITTKNKSSFALLGITNGLLILTHYWGFFVVIAEIAAIVLMQQEKNIKALLKSLVITAIFFLPWLPIFLQQIKHGPAMWLSIENVWILPLRTLGLFMGGKAALVALTILALLRWKVILKNIKPIPTILLSLCLGATLLVALLVSLYSPLYLVGRHDVLLYPLFILLLVALVTAVHQKFFRGIAVTILVISFGLGTFEHFQKPKSADKLVAKYILDHATKDDVIIFTFLARTAFEYYHQQAGTPLTVKSYPSYIDAHAGYVSTWEMRQAKEKNTKDAENLAGICKEHIVQKNRCLVVYYDDEGVNPELLQTFEKTMGEPSDTVTIPERQAFYPEVMYWYGNK